MKAEYDTLWAANSEIDRLRAELEKAQSGPAWDLSQKRAVEIIELRPECESDFEDFKPSGRFAPGGMEGGA